MRKPLVLTVLALLAVTLALVGPGTAQKGPIKIGFVTSESGPLAANGRDMINGLQLYLEEQGGKLAGRKVKLIIEDDEGTGRSSSSRSGGWTSPSRHAAQ